MIREATAADWPNIWPIFSEITEGGDTYAYPVDTDRSTAEMLWMTKPDRTFVFEEDGEILGTYYLKTNQDGPGKHVCNCGYMVTSAARGRGLAQKMCLHSQGIAHNSSTISSKAAELKIYGKCNQTRKESCFS